MKSHALFLSLLIAATNCWADRHEARRACLFDNGLTNPNDMDRLMELLKPDATNTTTTTVQDVAFENKFACAIACDFHVAKSRNVTLAGNLERAIDADDKLSDAKKREMKDTLKACSLATGDDDDCTLLQCVSILQPPFVWILPKTSGILGMYIQFDVNCSWDSHWHHEIVFRSLRPFLCAAAFGNWSKRQLGRMSARKWTQDG
ncbi:uncharacterized protein LOC100677996 isoform X2 [Nasonia vitripennis]|uniref:Uncharacterized protein n=1 Tax=Nasonia vitripennis TaxID=7425 RepID=A0A7M7QG60_NASVI|nr:uncharacterized protein LOC100677996 isoform X2 [Nasonia vitripennis]